MPTQSGIIHPLTATIIIPVRNEEHRIAACLKSVLKSELPEGYYEIIVIDGMSTDRTMDVLSRFDWKNIRHRVLENPGKIVSCGLNLGIRAAKGRFIIRMDAHTLYSPDYLKQCIELLESGIAENVGGPMRIVAETPVEKAIAAATSSIFGVGNASFHFPENKGYVDTVYLGAWPKSLFDEIGYFDEELVRNQDDEFNFRMGKHGKRIFMTPDIQSLYHPRASFKSLWRQYFQYGYWKFRVAQKHQGIMSVRHLIPASFVIILLFTLMAGCLHPAAFWVFEFLAFTYMAVNILFSATAARHNSLNIVLMLPIVFFILHFSYGFGYLKGILDFGILRRHEKTKPRSPKKVFFSND